MKDRITPDDLEAMISEKEIIQFDNSTLTICILTLTNGCTITGKSNVINPANYDKEVGAAAALQNAKTQIWELEGYALKRDVQKRVLIAARTAHEANRMYCELCNDHSQLTWNDAPDWQKESAIQGVEAIRKNPESTPEDSHKSWLAHKLADGWAYGPEKDPNTKLHPCMVPYEDLPEHQRYKDDLFQTTVRSVLAD
jgi:hypothetical protein